jgi:glucokinase
LLRRSTPKIKPATPEPTDPSAIPEATVPAPPDAETNEDSSEVKSVDVEEGPEPSPTPRSLPKVESRAAKLPNVPSQRHEIPLDSSPRQPAPERPRHDLPVGDPEIAGAPEALDRASHLPNVPEAPSAPESPAVSTFGFSQAPKAPRTPPPVPPAAVAAAATGFDDPAPEAPAKVPPATGMTPPAPATRLHTEIRAATLTGGIDLGGTKIAAAVIGPKHEVLAYRRRPTPTTGGPSDVIKAMATTMQEAAQDAGVEAHQLRAVGVGSPGSVDSTTGSVAGAGNLPGWGGSYPLGTALRDILGTPVFVGNDVQVGTNAEFLLGAGAGYRSLLGVFWGTGVGGGIVLDGKPWRGRGRAGEIGHTLVKRGGAPNSNGLNGTVEAYAGRKAMQAKVEREMKKGRKTDLFKIMEKHGKTNLTSAVWAHALEHNDELATELLNRAVKALSAGIASAVNLLDVEAVVIGGGLGVRFADTLVPQIIDGMNAYLLDADNPPAIKVAGLGDEGGVIGAALLV